MQTLLTVIYGLKMLNFEPYYNFAICLVVHELVIRFSS